VSALGSILNEIAGALFDSVLGALRDMYREWQLKKAEAKAASLEAEMEGRRQAHELMEKIRDEVNKVQKVESWEEFKRPSVGRLIIYLAPLLFLAGCCVRQGYNNSQMPILEVEGDPRSELDTSSTPTRNERLLMEYILRLETTIEVYNREAERLNKEREAQ